MTTQIEALAALLTAHALPARVEGGRIYLNRVPLDVTAFIALNNPGREVGVLENMHGPGRRDPMGLFYGAALMVSSSAADLTEAWGIELVKRDKHLILCWIAAAMIADGCPADHWQVPDDWRDVIL